MLAKQAGAAITPVWNKSNREHLIVGSEPDQVRSAADAAARALKWQGAHHVDADHINLDTVDRFIAGSDFYTIDVADDIGQAAAPEDVAAFIERHPELIGELTIAGIATPLSVTRDDVERIANTFLAAVQKAATIYQHIADQKGADHFATEISMDETELPQTPVDLLVILVAIADHNVPVQTIAPKFTGRFNKGVDYVGDLAQFEIEFISDLAVIAHAIEAYNLPVSLKLSVHSGSDKFSIYPLIRAALAKFNGGLHIKTAGTTWLEEVIGLAEAGGDGLALAKDIYAQALSHAEELCAPYATVIDIDTKQLPSAEAVAGWSSTDFVSAIRHDQTNARYNQHMRQLLHVGFKIAAKMGDRYLIALKTFEAVISKNVTENLFERHMKPLFVG